MPKWANFKFPVIDYSNKAEGTEGSEIYKKLVPKPFIQQHVLGKDVSTDKLWEEYQAFLTK